MGREDEGGGPDFQSDGGGGGGGAMGGCHVSIVVNVTECTSHGRSFYHIPQFNFDLGSHLR